MHDNGKSGRARRPLPRWKKVLLTFAGGLLVVGLGLQLPGLLGGGDAGRKISKDPENRAGTAREPPATGQTLLAPDAREDGDSQAGRVPAAEPTVERVAANEGGALTEWSPGLAKGGFGFFLGFCIGYAVRTFFRIGALVIGLVLLALLGLSYTGVMPPPDWGAIEGHLGRLGESLREQASGFRTFLTGNLPSAGLAGLGVFTGFKKN